MGKNKIFPLCFLSLLAVFPSVESRIVLPLSTKSRFIVDQTGQKRVKLACVNWPAHLEPVVAEGLSKQPLNDISKQISAMGFNCVRLTWPLFLATNKTLASLTVQKSFSRLGLKDAIRGLKLYNPSILDLTLMDAFKAVVSSLGKHDLMVILDNHTTQAMWCCSDDDKNGFFKDKIFNPKEWLDGLARMAKTFKGTSNVIGMSLRNELRGQKQNLPEWYRYMQQGAETVHSANPNVLVILSGLNYDTDISFLSSKPVSLSFKGKLVYEIHLYASSDKAAWEQKDKDKACRIVKNNFHRKGGFLLKKGFPLLVSEFGGNLNGNNAIDNFFFNCFFSLASELDFEWALWTLVGSYYTRKLAVNVDESYGLLTSDWKSLRNPSFSKRLVAIQRPK